MRLGILGGSGVYQIEGLKDVTRRVLTTPFGAPSDDYVCGVLEGVEIAFLPRHGKGHRLMPAEINHRANVYGFKLLGVEFALSISAVGSLKESLRPRDIVLPDQYFDRTKQSGAHTFFGNGAVAHIAFSDPTCPSLRAVAAAAAERLIRERGQDLRVQSGGTYVNMEGPAFSTRAESNYYRHFGFDVIGMTSLAEAKLFREAEICYQSICMVTDYDCWHHAESPVTVEMIIGHLRANSELGMSIVRAVAASLPAERRCECGDALRNALLTPPDAIPVETRQRLGPILSRYAR